MQNLCCVMHFNCAFLQFSLAWTLENGLLNKEQVEPIRILHSVGGSTEHCFSPSLLRRRTNMRNVSKYSFLIVMVYNLVHFYHH